MKTKHTPLKLIVEYQQYTDGTHVCVAYENGDWFCDCGLEGDPIAERNAKLIATAPETAAERDKLKEINAELLKALKAAHTILIEANEKWSNGEDCYESALNLCEQAIQKAE